MRRSKLSPVLLLLALCAPAPEALAADGADAGANIQVTITLGDAEERSEPQRVYRLLARDGGPPARMLMGWRMPMPTQRAEVEQVEAPVTSYVYQNVGVTANLTARRVPDGRVLVDGQIEVSGVREGKEGSEHAGMPVIGTFQQAVNVLLREGKPLRVAQVPDPEGGSLFLELAVEVLE
jgi:hypothetical protein